MTDLPEEASVERVPSEAELAEIQARADAANEGAWEFSPNNGVHNPNGVAIATTYGPYQRANAEFIAHARQDVEALTRAVRVLQGQVERVRAAHRVQHGLDWDCPECWLIHALDAEPEPTDD